MIKIFNKKDFDEFQHRKIKKYDIPEPTSLRKSRGGKGPKNQDIDKHATDLKADMVVVKKEHNRIMKKGIYPDENPALIFILELEDNVDPTKPDKIEKYDVEDDKLINSGLTVLEKEDDQWLIVFSSNNEAKLFYERLQSYQTERTPRLNPRYANIFSNIKSIKPLNPELRLGKKLRRFYLENTFPTKIFNVRIDFWWLSTITPNIMKLCKKTIEENKGKVIDEYSEYQIASIIAIITPEILKTVMEFTEISNIEIIEKKRQDRADFSQISIEDMPPLDLTEINSKPFVCLIDTGVLEKHPLLNGCVVEPSINMCNDSEIASDEDGHGTCISGSLLYFDIEEKLRNHPEKLIPDARLISVKIRQEFITQNVSDLNHKIIQAINEVYEKYSCKIFVLTYLPVNEEAEYPIKTREHQLSLLLDRLISEKNIVVITPIGNINPQYYFENSIERIEQLNNGNYLKHLLNNKIIEGASANSVLTVGSIAGFDRLLEGSSINPASIRFFANKEDPAPNTRSGFGLGKAIKPDFCAIGGNLVFRPESPLSIKKIRSTSILGPNISYLIPEAGESSNLLIDDIGTCFSACRVGNLCAKLMYFYPGYKGNLYRALLANRSKIFSFSEQNSHNELSKEEKLQITGYGKVGDNQVFYGNKKTITLVFEGELEIKNFHVFKIPIPESFKSTNARRGVIVSLAYNPPVLRRKQYRGIKMDFDYIYDNLTENDLIHRYNEKFDGDYPEKRSESNNLFKIDISSTIRNNSTLQLSRFDFPMFSSRHIKAKDKMLDSNHYIVVKCKNYSWFDHEAFGLEKQQYALVVTIWHENSIQIYNEVYQKIQIKEHVRELR